MTGKDGSSSQTSWGKDPLVGDDLFVTEHRKTGAGNPGGIANSILIKVNQIGTLTETLEAMRMAKEAVTPVWFPSIRRNRRYVYR